MNYLIANGLLVVLLTPVSYVLDHWRTFASGLPAQDNQVGGQPASAHPRARAATQTAGGLPSLVAGGLPSWVVLLARCDDVSESARLDRENLDTF